MAFRRSSSLSREDGLTLEQRLVMQLTAAMRHEDSMHAVEEPAGDAAPGAAGADGAQPGSTAVAHAPGHTAPEAPAMGASELSTMLRTLGASLETLGSAIGNSSDGSIAAHGVHDPNSAHVQHASLLPHAGADHLAALPTGGSDQSLLSGLGSLEGLGNLSQLGNLGNLLSSVGMQDHQASTDLAMSLGALGNLDLGNIMGLSSLGTNAPTAAGLEPAGPPPPAGAGMRLDSTHLDAAAAASAVQPPAGPAARVTSHSADASSAQSSADPARSELSNDHAHLGLSQIEIDPDVSSIQSVLQSLLTGGSGNIGEFSAEPDSTSPAGAAGSAGKDGATSEPTAGESGPGTASTGSMASTAGTATALGTAMDETRDFDMPSLSSFGLETEDRMLVDSLRLAIESQLAGTAAGTAAGVAEGAASLGAAADAVADAQLPSRVRATQKPRATSRAKKPRAPSVTQADSLASSSFREQSLDFGASDPDTLRAIQQALLSALGPTAASTSLTETLTSELKTATSTVPVGAAAGESPSAGAGSSTQTERPATAGSASAKAAERVLRLPAKKAAAKVTKPTERDRQKLREENAARKRRWREENVLQNRDNDLRARIIRRAQTMYGEGDSAEKAEWIETEYQRRRQKRILRADINSLVANAMESARSRAASEQAGGAHRAGEQPLTLTQQTRQIASSQLSELFRRSNAVLEPQLHAEKLSVPLAPYLLVPSPNRPPYKVEWRRDAAAASLTVPNKGLKDADTPMPDAGAPASAGDTERAGARTDTSVAAPGQDASAEKVAESGTGSADAGASLTSTSTSASASASGSGSASTPSGTAASGISASGATASGVSASGTSPPGDAAPGGRASPITASGTTVSDGSPLPNNEDSDKTGSPADADAGRARRLPVPMRPKHRYGLVGNAQLGVPPNLAAIYQKMLARGTPETA